MIEVKLMLAFVFYPSILPDVATAKGNYSCNLLSNTLSALQKAMKSLLPAEWGKTQRVPLL